VVLATVGIAVLCGGAGGATALLRRAQLGGDATAGEVARAPEAAMPQPEPPPRPAARRSIMLSEGGYAVRALLPESMPAAQEVELLFDVWDPRGEPLAAPAIPVELASAGDAPSERPGPDTALAARPVDGLPGRYRLVASFPQPGEAAALLELAAGSSIHVHFDIAPAR
jgi:hypothetical protein